MAENNFDAVIIGGGPAGLTAGIYVSRAGLKSVLLEKGVFGGQITNAEHVENFPGFPQGISGIELGDLMHEQAEKYDLKIESDEAVGIEIRGSDKIIKTIEETYNTKAVILAGGSVRKKLGVPGEDIYVGKGVSYCATCDSAFFKDMPVVVAGGGDAALTEALHLSKHASLVTVIHRRHELRATRILQERAFADKKIRFLWSTTIAAIEGDALVKRIKLANVQTGKTSQLETAGVFISVGFEPASGLVKGLLTLDEIGHVVTNENMETSIKGIFAAGDIRHNSARQAITAAGDGATAAINAQKYLTEN
jgi:thioredoxin reductase (NADPH)